MEYVSSGGIPGGTKRQSVQKMSDLEQIKRLDLNTGKRVSSIVRLRSASNIITKSTRSMTLFMILESNFFPSRSFARNPNAANLSGCIDRLGSSRSSL